MKINLTIGLAIALAISVLVNIGLGWRLAGAKPRCELDKASETGKANVIMRSDEGKRDVALDRVKADTQADTREAVGQTMENTRERTATILRIPVPVPGACRAPAGLPSLDAAVDQANAAAGD